MENQTPTNSELFRQNSEMKSDLKEYIRDSGEWRRSLTEIVSSIDKRVAVANGRTGDNEKAITLLGTEYAEVRKEVNDLMGMRKWLIGALAVFIFLQGALIMLARYWVQDIAQHVVSEALLPYEVPDNK